MKRWTQQLILLLGVWVCCLTLGVALSHARVPVGDFISTQGQRLTLVFYPDSNVYELTPFSRPRYDILSNAQGEAQLLIRGFYTQMEEPQTLAVNVGPIEEIGLMSDSRGTRLQAKSTCMLVIEHTRESIRFLTGSPIAQRESVSPSYVPDTVVTRPTVGEWLPGSHLSVYVFWETGSLRRDEVVVDGDGAISYQELGRFAIKASSLVQLQLQLQQGLSLYLRHFDVGVHSRQISGSIITVLGALQRPEAQGEYAWTSGIRAADLLDSLGGVHAEAEQRVALYRMVDGEYERQWVDLGAFPNLAGEGLRPSDILYVPKRRQRSEIAVFGLVKRPGAQIVSEGTTFSKALETAGGTTATISNALSVSILRQDGESLEVAYNQLKGQRDLPLKHGDVVYLHTRVP